MNLESDKRLNIQLRLDFSSVPTGEARQAGWEDIESLSTMSEPERPANTSRIMELLVERVDVRTDRVDIKLRIAGATSLIGELTGNSTAERDAA